MSINPRILGACVVGAIFIAFAYFFAPTKGVPGTGDSADQFVAVAPVREYIEIGDSDNDGIPDWSESFRQAEVPVIDQASLEDTGEAYAPPDTLTGQLAVDMFSKMVQGQARGPLGPSQEDILGSSDRKMKEAAQDELYKLSELTITSDNSPEALRVYGNRVAEILVTYIPGPEVRNEVDIIQHAVQSQKPEVLEELTPIIDGYSQILTHLLDVSVPSSIATDHLNLVNAASAMHTDLQGMEEAFSDPIYTIVRMQRYYDDATGRNNAILNIYNSLGAQEIIWDEDDMVSQLISF